VVLGDKNYQEKHPRVQSDFTDTETARLRELLDRMAGQAIGVDDGAP